MLILQLILCAVLGYLLGNIQTGLIVGHFSQNVDLRNHGSGSSGATNALRVLGKKSALFTLLGDAAKGMLATGVGFIVAGWQGGMVGALFVVIGHIWPAFFGFRGGKGVVTSIGSLLLLMPIHTLLFLVIGILVIVLTKMVSLGSISAAVVFLITASITAISKGDWFLLVFSILMAFLVIFAHRTNICRIAKGTEGKLSASMFSRKKGSK